MADYLAVLQLSEAMLTSLSTSPTTKWHFLLWCLDQMHLSVSDSSKNAGQGALWVKTLKAITIYSQKCISVYFGVRTFSSLTKMVIASSQCDPDETIVAALWWACAPIGWIKGGEGQARARHDTTPLWGWFEVHGGKMEGAKLALICPSPALGPKGWDCELLCSGCIPAIRLSGRETRLGPVDVKQGVGVWATESKTEMWESSSLPRLLMNKTFFSFFSWEIRNRKVKQTWIGNILTWSSISLQSLKKISD